MTSTVYAPHDHHICITSALANAKALCESRGARLTPVRRRVLELVWQNHKPTGAYELLPQLAQDGFNSAPPTVYRSLDFLLELGLIHRISSLNAFIGCAHPDQEHTTGFFICRLCGNALELSPERMKEVNSRLADELGIIIEQQTIELSGLCPSCQLSAATAHEAEA